jgi:hypothetical protein
MPRFFVFIICGTAGIMDNCRAQSLVAKRALSRGINEMPMDACVFCWG